MVTPEMEKAANDENLEQMLLDYFGRGGTFKDLKGMNSDTMEAIYSVAFNLYQGGKFDEALKVFQFLCFYDHFNKKYYLGMGACQQMMKQHETAIEIFTYAAVLDGDDPRAMMYIGDCHMGMGDKDKARQSYEMAVEWAGDNAEYAQDKARAEALMEAASV